MTSSVKCSTKKKKCTSEINNLQDLDNTNRFEKCKIDTKNETVPSGIMSEIFLIF